MAFVSGCSLAHVHVDLHIAMNVCMAFDYMCVLSSHTHSLTYSHTHALTHTLPHQLTHSHTHTHCLTHSLMHSHTHTHTHTPSCTHTPSRTHTHTPSQLLELSTRLEDLEEDQKNIHGAKVKLKRENTDLKQK